MDPTCGSVMAGVGRTDESSLADARSVRRAGELRPAWHAADTALGVAGRDAQLARPEATKLAQVAHDGLARSTVPGHTMVDGDAIVALATGTHPAPANLLVPAALAAEALADVVARAACMSTGTPGLPAAGDLA